MALKMTSREVDGVAVLSLDGRIVFGEETNALREKVEDLIASGKKKVVLNMNDVTLIDSSGLGALVSAHSSAKSKEASLRLWQLGVEVQGTAADHQAAHRLRGFRYRNRCGAQLIGVTLG